MKLKRFSEPVWIKYPEASEVEFLIRPMKFSDSLDVRSKIRQRAPTELTDEAGRKRMEILEDIDLGLFTWEIFNGVLEDWKGIEVEDVQDPQKDRLEIKKAIFNEETFRTFIMKKADELQKAEQRKLEAERKN